MRRFLAYVRLLIALYRAQWALRGLIRALEERDRRWRDEPI